MPKTRTKITASYRDSLERKGLTMTTVVIPKDKQEHVKHEAMLLRESHVLGKPYEAVKEYYKDQAPD